MKKGEKITSYAQRDRALTRRAANEYAGIRGVYEWHGSAIFIAYLSKMGTRIDPAIRGQSVGWTKT